MKYRYFKRPFSLLRICTENFNPEKMPLLFPKRHIGGNLNVFYKIKIGPAETLQRTNRIRIIHAMSSLSALEENRLIII